MQFVDFKKPEQQTCVHAPVTGVTAKVFNELEGFQVFMGYEVLRESL